MRVLEVSERSTVDIPMSELIQSGGQLKIRPDLIGRGLVEIRQSKNKLQLRVNGLVGRLPVTNDLALDVHPKFPVSNLNRMVYASRSGLSNPFYSERPFRHLHTKDYLPVPLIRSLTASLKELIGNGVYREYIREVVVGTPKPKINFLKSHQKFWSRLKLTSAVVERFSFTQDNLPNQCIKLAATKALAISKTSDHLQECVSTLAESLRQLERITLLSTSVIGSELHHIRSTVPAFRLDYVKALDCALEIIRNIDVSLDTSRSGLNLESYIIFLDDVFEQYIRSVLAHFPAQENGSIATVDGNLLRHQRSLFTDNKKYRIKPDLIMKDANGVHMIGDVKYKTKPKEEDRYQIIAHALSYGVKSAILIYPKLPTQKNSGLNRLGFIGALSNEIEVFEYFFDLSKPLDDEEVALRSIVQPLIFRAGA